MAQSLVRKKYVGWVPCLNGQLVFDLIECGLNDDSSKVEIVHHAIDDDNKTNEYILLHSTVDWKDFDDSKEELSGLWSVIVLSNRSLDNNKHKGSIYFMPKKRGAVEEWDETIKMACDINYQLNTQEEIDILQLFSIFKKNIDEKILVNSKCYSAIFELDQDGIVWVDPLSEDEREGRIIARQAYYYIKYSWHKHQHHDSRAETLTTVHEASRAETIHDLSNTEKERIADRTISDLKKNLVKFKRQIDSTSHKEVLKAKGIVSYTKALVEIMRSRHYIDDDFYKREINHLGYFQESLDIISVGIEKDMALYGQAVNEARALILFIFSMVTPALIANKLTASSSLSSTPDYIQWIANLYSSGVNFTTFIVLVIAFIFFYITINSHYGNFWIFFSGIKKSVAFIVKDRAPKGILSNSTIMSIIIVLLGILSMIFGVYQLFLILK